MPVTIGRRKLIAARAAARVAKAATTTIPILFGTGLGSDFARMETTTVISKSLYFLNPKGSASWL